MTNEANFDRQWRYVGTGPDGAEVDSRTLSDDKDAFEYFRLLLGAAVPEITITRVSDLGTEVNVGTVRRSRER